MAVIMKGKDVANSIKEEIKKEVEQLKSLDTSPLAAIIRVGDLSDSVGYERSATRILKQAGIGVKTYHFTKDITEEEFISEFKKINNDELVHGILLLRPIPEHLNIDKVSMIINPEKDIDGMSPFNIGTVLSPEENDFVPCTPAAVMAALDHYGIDLQGKDVAVIGHSLTVGRPLSMLLAAENATVTLCHIHTKDTQSVCKQADIIITATGSIGLITKNHVKEGAVVIDVGTTYDEDGKLHGDVRFDEVSEKASHITPVPGGVGAITTMILAQRVVVAAKMQQKKALS